jgi:hypothetical protein
MSATAIVGQSGTGKTTSMTNIPEMDIEGLNPKETVVINVAGKDLPFRGWKKVYKGKLTEGGNYVETSNADLIVKSINYIKENRKDIKNIVIDDSQYIMAFEFMSRAKENGYGKFADIGVNMGRIVNAAKDAGSDIKVYFMWHPEKDTETTLKMKTVGKMVDDYLTLEGLFTVILYTKVTKVDNKMVYQFVTNNDGYYPAKSPIGMFKDMYVSNDLGKVARAIDTYNNGDDE